MFARRSNGPTGGSESCVGIGRRPGALWTCNGCNRNNEARFDACHHCRSSRGPSSGARAYTADSSRKSFPPRVTPATNPFRRFVQNGGGAIGAATGSDRSFVGRNSSSDSSGFSKDNRARTQNQQQQGESRTIRRVPLMNSTHNNINRPGITDSATNGNIQGRSTDNVDGRHASIPGNAHRRTEGNLMTTHRAPIDAEAAQTWIYPVNYPVRQYQLQIVTEALFRNTLVALPTGLGKTLIAAVVMYNYYRWFPEGKVVFLAPTKPLVAQQISACYDIMGVPEHDTAELQGSVPPEKRQELWDERRVFFCTPQSMANDIKKKRCDPGRFVCVVVDEAHRGTGNYAYVNVIREVAAATPHFRVLALSATPGSDIKTIQQVLENLRISHIECRSEDDPEVARHTHARQIEVVKCKLGSHIDAIRQDLVSVLQPLVSRMANKRIIFTRDPMALKPWTVIQSLHTFRRTSHESGRGYMAGEVESEMAILNKVVQAKDTLVTHGAAGCLNKLARMEHEVKQRGFRSNAEKGIIKHEAWESLMKLLRQTAENTAGVSVKHPKLVKLKEVLREHFARHEAAGKSTRAIVFTQFRDSVEEITDFLAGEELLRVKAFIGQGNSTGAKARAAAAAAEAAKLKAGLQGGGGGGEEGDMMEDMDDLAPKQRLKGQTQKEQKAVVKAFFGGEFNCLVATCIAEEGLDIGEVDLIVSFDALNSPVRMVQRMGRTGRKRAGKVVVLVAEGSEESKLRNSNSKSKSITKALQTRKDKFEMFKGDDPMVPPGPRPRRVEQEMVIVEYHLSQVGGHQRKAGRKNGGTGGGGGGKPAGGSGISAWDDWRLTAAQEETRVEAYSGEPGTATYVPDACSGWSRQKLPYASGQVARSTRSRLLCEMKDFVAHQEWELLYDPSDVELMMASLSDKKDEMSPAFREGDAARCSGGGGNDGDGDEIDAAPDVTVLTPVGKSGGESGENSCGKSGGVADVRAINRSSSAANKTANGDQCDEGAAKNGNLRGTNARAKVNHVSRMKAGTDSPTRPASSARSSVRQNKIAQSSPGSSKEVGTSGAAVDGGPKPNISGVDRILTPNDRGSTLAYDDAVNDRDDDEDTQSDPGFRSPSVRSGLASCSTSRSSDDIEGRISCSGESQGRRSRSDGPTRDMTGGQRYSCGCSVRDGRQSCETCASATLSTHLPAVVEAPSASLSRRTGYRQGSSVGGIPHQALSPPTRSAALSPAMPTGGIGTSELAHSFERRASGTPTSGNRCSSDDTHSTCSRRADDTAPGTGSQPNRLDRWQCGCGCRMKAGGKRCVMCGQLRPAQGEVSLSSGSDGVGGESGDGGISHSDRSSGATGGVRAHDTRETTGDSCNSVGRGEGNGGEKSFLSPTVTASARKPASDGSNAAKTGVNATRWQCAVCGSEYRASRLKCRACGASRPADSAATARKDAIEVKGSLRSSERPRKPLSTKSPTEDVEVSIRAAESAARDGGEIVIESSRIQEEISRKERHDVGKSPGASGSKNGAVHDVCVDFDDGDIDPASVTGVRDKAVGSHSAVTAHVPAAPVAMFPATSDVASAGDTCPQLAGQASRHDSLGPAPASNTTAGDGTALSSSHETNSQSQEDCFGDLFPSLHQFGTENVAIVGHDEVGGEGKTTRTSGSHDNVLSIAEELGRDDVSSPKLPLIAAPPVPLLLRSVPPTLATTRRASHGDSSVIHPIVDGVLSVPRDAADRLADGHPAERHATALDESVFVRHASRAAAESTASSSVHATTADARISSEEQRRTEDGGAAVATAAATAAEDVSLDDALIKRISPLIDKADDGRLKGSAFRDRRGADDDCTIGALPPHGGRANGACGGTEDTGSEAAVCGVKVDRKNEEVSCGVCGSASSEDDDPIILCDGPSDCCSTAVHADCYGVAKVPEGPWLCDPCASVDETAAKVSGDRGGDVSSSLSPPRRRCALCSHAGGALKLSRCGKWVHVVCVWWTPELSTDPETVRPGSLQQLDPDRAGLTCSACHGRGGAAVQCAATACLEACHPFCAMRAGFVLHETGGDFELFCRTHSRRERQRRSEVDVTTQASNPLVASERKEQEHVGNVGLVVAPAVVSGRDVDGDISGADKPAVRTPAARVKAGDNGTAAAKTPLTCALTPPTPRLASASSGGIAFSNECEDGTLAQAQGERVARLLSKDSKRSSLARRRPRDADGGPRRKRTKMLMDLGDEEDDGEEEQDAAVSGSSVKGAEVTITSEEHTTTDLSIDKVSAAQEGGEGTGTPLKVFDMAPPPTQLPQASSPLSASSTLDAQDRGATTPPVKHGRRRARSGRLSLSSTPSGGAGGAGSVDSAESPVQKTIAARNGENSEDGGDHGDGLMTLSQAVSPASEEKQYKKRRRLNKASKRLVKQRHETHANDGAEPQESSRKGNDDISGSKTRGRKRACDFDKASYRRFIETEAEVDEDVSDDDEVELENEYDSEDSFVNDGPLSYETCSSGEDDEEEMGDDTMPRLRKEGRQDDFDYTGDRRGSAGKDSITPEKSKKRKKVKRSRFEDADDEKGMYLQLLAQSQPLAGPSSRRRDKGQGNNGGNVSDGVRRQARGRDRDDRCDGSHGARRNDGRFAFINAVMAHARDGGDPLDVEDACGSENGFAQEDYNGTPQSTTPTPTRRGQFGAKTGADWSPCDAMSSGSSAASSQPRQACDVEPGLQPMYSQALRQAYPGSPSSPRTAAAVEKTSSDRRLYSITRGKENVPPQLPPARLNGRETNDASNPKSGTVTDTPSASAATRTRTELHGVTAPTGKPAELNKSRSLASTDLNADSSRRSTPPSGEMVGKKAGNGVTTSSSSVSASTPASGSAPASQSSGGTSLTERQRQTMSENRAKALARLKQRQQAAATAATTSTGDSFGADKDALPPPVGPDNESGSRNKKLRNGEERVRSESIAVGGLISPTSQQQQPTRRSSISRERFCMTMDLDSGDDSDGVERDAPDGNHTDVRAVPRSTAIPRCASASNFDGGCSTVQSQAADDGLGRAGSSQAPITSDAAPSVRTARSTSTREVSRSSIVSAVDAGPVIPPPAPAPSPAGVSTKSLATPICTLPFSAPRATALGTLAGELRSRPGFSVHASPLGGGLRDVDVVVGAQCAVCVRTRKQLLSQTHAVSPSSPSQSTVSCASPASTAASTTAARGGADSVSAAEAPAPLLALLRACLQRYARVVVVVEGLVEGSASMIGGGHQRDAVGMIQALRGASVVSSSGPRETAEMVVAMVAREAKADVGLPQEVTGPSLTTAQSKFLTFLLRAPMLSYPGGLFLLQAFRGRSVKEVIASSARQFQAAVPGMTAQQAAKLKRFLTSCSSGGGASRPVARVHAAGRKAS